MPHGAGRIRIGRLLGRIGCLTLFGVALLGALPASSAARAQPPVVLGNWESPGFGELHVRAIGSHFSGTIVHPDPDSICPLKVGSEAWRIGNSISGPPNAWIYTGSVVFSHTNPCGPAGFGNAQWNFSTVPDSGQLCAFPPGGGGQQCLDFSRVGLLPNGLAPYSVSGVLVRCMSDTDFYRRLTYVCNQLYYAAHPGKMRTEVFYCTLNGGANFGEYRQCPGGLYDCTGATDWKISSCRPTLPHARITRRRSLATASRPRTRRVRLVPVAKGSLRFAARGYEGLDIKTTKRGRKRLKKLARRHKKLTLVVASAFKPAGGGRIRADSARFKIKRKG